MDADLFKRNVAEAKRRVSDMDKTDGKRDRSLITIYYALAAGIHNEKTGALFDALVMLDDLVSEASQ